MNDLRQLPSVDLIKRSEALAAFPDAVRTSAARTAIESARKAGRWETEAIVAEAAREAERLTTPNLRSAINLSGIILHTGLGRARLAAAAVNAIYQVAYNHSIVEYDLETGTRGDRQAHVRQLLCDLTGAEDALVVNNCAASVLLSLAALCQGRDVVLSRGQMVEIGGAFRMPDVVRQSGCRLVEVGCTNRTRLSDYEAVIGPEIGAILRCHPSNFKIVGFTEEAPLRDLVALARRRETIVIDDAGSGCLLDTTRFGLSAEPRLQDAIREGADLVLCSGDKLLGGPQAGVILGRRSLIEVIRQHPMARAVRIDKLTLAGLEATLRLYRDGRELEIPVWEAVDKSSEQVKSLAEKIQAKCPLPSQVVPTQTEIGGGSLPASTVPSWAVQLAVNDPVETLKLLRQRAIPIIGRLDNGAVLLDLRTLHPDEVGEVQRALTELHPWRPGENGPRTATIVPDVAGSNPDPQDRRNEAG